MAVIDVKFFSNTLRRTVPFTAVIPNDEEFFESKKIIEEDKPFKTLYLLHGFSGDETDYLMNTRIKEIACKYKIAIIMPAGNNGFYIDHPSRMESYGEYIGEELVEYTRRLFNLSRKREDTFIGGLSMGGFGAVRNGLKYSDKFSKILSFSGAYVMLPIADEKRYIPDVVSTVEYQQAIWGDCNKLRESDKDPRWIIDSLIEEKKEIPQIFMTIGKQDFLLPVNHIFKEFIEAKKIDITYIEDDGVHDWEYWNKHLEKSIKWLLG